MATKFKVFFSWFTGNEQVKMKPLQGEMGFSVPADIWQDWERRFEAAANGEEFLLRDSLLYKAIQPDVPAKGRKLWNFSFVIEGEGMAHDVLADPQCGPFQKRPKTECERQFTYWAFEMAKAKMKVTPMWPSK